MSSISLPSLDEIQPRWPRSCQHLAADDETYTKNWCRLHSVTGERVGAVRSASVVELCVIGIQVWMHRMLLQQVNNVFSIRDEAAWAQNWASWRTLQSTGKLAVWPPLHVKVSSPICQICSSALNVQKFDSHQLRHEQELRSICSAHKFTVWHDSNIYCFYLLWSWNAGLCMAW